MSSSARPAIFLPDDSHICDCADYGDADFIVTLNPRDLPPASLRAKVIGPATRCPVCAQQLGAGIRETCDVYLSLTSRALLLDEALRDDCAAPCS